jgi:NSS family neurotransmitter:Na+ symporter
MEPIFRWGPWLDIISIYIIPIGATLGAISWFWVMKKDDMLDEINKGAVKIQGTFWHGMGKYVYVPLVVILCLVALFKQISF